MTPELAALALAALLQFAQLGVFGYYVRRQGNLDYQASNRDEPPPHTGKAARAQRAMANHSENLILFAIAVTVVTLADEGTRLTAICALGPVRSLVWGIGWVATLLMLLAAFV
jgi:uncharacterized MAPEG superfamily protein